MDKFNNTIGGIETQTISLPMGGACDQPENQIGSTIDSDSDIGSCGVSDNDNSNEKILIKLDCGIEIHIPLEIAKTIQSELNDKDDA